MAALSSGKTYYRVIFKKTVDGNTKTKTFYFKRSDYRKKDVQQWRARQELEYKSGKWNPWSDKIAGSVSLQEAISQHKARAKKELAASTYDIRSRYLDLFSDYVGNISIEECSADHGNEWINQKLKFPTKKNRLKTLSVFFKWAGKRWDVNVHGLEVVAGLAEKKRYYSKQHKAFITEPQLHRIIENISPKTRCDRGDLKDFYRLAFYTTRRRSDLLNVKPSWIFPKEPLLKVGDKDYLPKSQIVEYVPLIEKAHKILLTYKNEPEKPIFDFTGDFVTKQFQDALERTLPQLKGMVSLHNLRDSGIMYLIYELNLDLKHVMSMTGHSDLRSLQIYMKPWAEKTLEEVKAL